MHKALVIDTSAYTAFLRGDASVKEYFTKAVHIYIPRIVIGEIYFGIYNGSRQDENVQLLQTLLASPRVSVVDTTNIAARGYGEIATELRRAGKPMQQNDIWIAAITKEIGVPLLTFDIGFKNILGIDVINPNMS